MALTFQSAEFRERLAKALLVFQKLSKEQIGPGDFGLIDVKDPDFDPADQADEIITPNTEVTVGPPDSGEKFTT